MVDAVNTATPNNYPSEMHEASARLAIEKKASLVMHPRHEQQQIQGEDVNTILLKSQELPIINYPNKAENVQGSSTPI